MCEGHRWTCERLWNFSLSSLWRKKKWQRNKELAAVEFERGTAQYKITELPTKPRGSGRVQLIEKAICVWYVSFFVLSVHILRHVNVWNSKEQVCCFQYVNNRVCLFEEIVCCMHGDVSRRMICRKKTCTNSLVEANASENVREKFAVASKPNRTMKYEGKSKNITNLGTRNYRVLHFA